MISKSIYTVVDMSFSNNSYKNDVLSSLFQKVRIKAFATGSNAHTLPISLEALKKGAYTVYNQPILWKYNPYMDDAMGHEEDEVPCGFVPQSDNNPITFIEENNRTYLVIDALLWTKYSGRLIDIFKRDGNKKSVSVEINAEAIERPYGDEVVDYVISGITILGDWLKPAVEGCAAEMIQFSEDKNKYLDIYNAEKNTIKIVNTKEASVNGTWENPRRKLLHPILEASNKNSLLKEAYLVPDLENPTTSSCKYPHHVIRNNELVIHVRGLQAAFSRAKQQGIFSGGVKAHLLRHYRELGMSTENFSEYGFSEEDFNMYFSEIESDGEKSMSVNKEFAIEGREAWGDVIDQVQKHEGKDAYVDSVEKNHIIYTKDKVRYRVEADVEVGKDDKTVKAKIKWDTVKKDADQNMSDDAHSRGGVADEYDDDTTKAEDEKQKEKDDKEAEKRFSDLEIKCADLETKCADLEAKCAELEKSNEAYMAKCEAMADYDELKKFKCETEEKMAQEEKLCKMSEVFASIEDKGFNFSDEVKKELTAKFAEYENIDGWSNYVKAFAFDNSQTSNGEIAIAYADAHQSKDTFCGIWDDII